MVISQAFAECPKEIFELNGDGIVSAQLSYCGSRKFRMGSFHEVGLNCSEPESGALNPMIGEN
jgi:hypothetical protein